MNHKIKFTPTEDQELTTAQNVLNNLFSEAEQGRYKEWEQYFIGARDRVTTVKEGQDNTQILLFHLRLAVTALNTHNSFPVPSLDTNSHAIAAMCSEVIRDLT